MDGSSDDKRTDRAGFRANEPGLVAAWLWLALLSLGVAGGLALVLAVARTPDLAPHLPQDLFHRALVAHVDFAVVVWFLAMLGALSVAARPGRATGFAGVVLASAGAVLMLVPILTGRGEAVLNNYVPLFTDPLFAGGLGLLFTGVALPVAKLLLRPPALGGVGTGAAGLIFLMAMICLFFALQRLPVGTDPLTDGEEIFWGAGHLLQYVYTALLLSSWQTLGGRLYGQPALAPKAWKRLASLLVLVALPGPLLYVLGGFVHADLRKAFTDLYWIGLPLPILIGLIAQIRQISRHPRDWRSPAFLGLVLSLALSVQGALFGMFADGADTRTPGHYHAEIGALNLAFMAMINAVLLPGLGRGAPEGRAARLQFWLYGLGQAVFSVGYFIAGWEGVARKVAGADQGLDSLVKKFGMGLSGAGGLIAVIGGIVFVWLALKRLASPARG